MQIDHIDVIHLKFDYPQRHGFRYSGGVCHGRLTSLIAVHTDTGHVGHGAAYSHPTLVDVIVKQQLEPVLRGEDPRQVEDLWHQMYGLTRWYGRKGVAMTTIGGLDTAFWDLRGQSLGKPLWSILGGSRDACPIYASGLLWDAPHELAEEAAGYIDQGFTRVKMRAARGAEMDRAAVTAVSQAIGPHHNLIVDGSMRYSVEEARSFANFLAQHDVLWFEEPFAPEDPDSFKALRGTIKVPVAAGENEFGVQGFRELIDGGWVDIVQPDAARCGGVSEVIKIGHMADERNLRVATHSWSDAIAITANAHLIAAMPNSITAEMDRTGNPFVDELLVEPLKIDNGVLKLSGAPGLGVELSQDVVEEFRFDPYTELDDGQYSDLAFGKGLFTPAKANQ